MTKATEIRLTVTDDEHWLDSWPVAIADALRPFVGQEVIVTVKLAAKRRSNKLNRYWWQVAVPMVREHLLEHAAMSDECRAEFNNEMVHQIIKLATGVSHIVGIPDGRGLRNIHIEGRSRTKTNKEFLDFILQTQKWASETLGLYLPDPNEAPIESYEEMLRQDAP